MEKFIDKDWWGHVDEFEIVNEFPLGYVVWNIGRENFPHEGYLPLVKPDPDREFGILRKDMKAFKCSSEAEALYILERAARGDFRKVRRSDGITVEIYNELVKEYEKVCNVCRP